jgi:membrane associated rhomboid family serine protease
MLSTLIPIRDLNPTRRFPVVTVVLIGMNVLAFFATAQGLALGQREAFQYGAVPCDVLSMCDAFSRELDQVFPSRSSLLTLFTSMFMHGDILHIAFNMLFLWVFGNNVEDRLGHVKYAIFYVVTGLAAAFAHIYTAQGSQTPIVGASGAISGILGAYIIVWPTATIVNLVPLGFFFFTVRMPAFVSLGLWFIFQLFSGLANSGIEQGEGGVAFWAHIGGFVAGAVLIIPFGGRRRPEGVINDPRFGDDRFGNDADHRRGWDDRFD